MARKRAPHWQVRLRVTSVVSGIVVVTGVERMDTQRYAAKQWKTRFLEEWRGRQHLEVPGRRTPDTAGERALVRRQTCS